MKHFTLILLALSLLSVAPAVSQLSVTNITPALGSVNVPLTTTVSITFSGPIDTTMELTDDRAIFQNFDTVDAHWYSPDMQTLYFAVKLRTSATYFLLVYYARAEGGATLDAPAGSEFTTAAAFTGHSVSGTISGGTTGISPKNTLVALSYTPLGDKGPAFAYGAIADTNGIYTIQHVQNGTYYPVCVKDVDKNGGIDPSQGDPIGLLDSIVVQGGDLTGVDMTLHVYGPIPFAEARHMSDSISAASLPPDRVLRLVESYNTDSTGQSGSWEFFYTSASADTGFEVQIEQPLPSVRLIDSNMYVSVRSMLPITNLAGAAIPESIAAAAERGGGSAFRHQRVPDSLTFQLRVSLGQLYRAEFWDIVPDTGAIYWGVLYEFVYNPNPNYWYPVLQKKFLADFATGAILVVTGVNPKDAAHLPAAYALRQNYPNPFNPSTVISFSLPRKSSVKLVIFDLLGREVARPVEGDYEPGEYTARFDAGALSGGVYFYRLTAGNFSETRKLLLLR